MAGGRTGGSSRDRIVKRAGRHAASAFCLSAVLAIAPDARADEKAFGQYLASECTTCHQISGEASNGIPPIVGWPRDQFIAVLKSYREKDRDNEVMQTIAGRLSDEEISALAAFFKEAGKN